MSGFIGPFILAAIVWLLVCGGASAAYKRGTQRRKREREQAEAALWALLRPLGVYTYQDGGELQRRRDAARYEIEAARRELEAARQELAEHLKNVQ